MTKTPSTLKGTIIIIMCDTTVEYDAVTVSSIMPDSQIDLVKYAALWPDDRRASLA